MNEPTSTPANVEPAAATTATPAAEPTQAQPTSNTGQQLLDTVLGTPRERGGETATATPTTNTKPTPATPKEATPATGGQTTQPQADPLRDYLGKWDGTFKANGKTYKVSNPDQLRQLLSTGALGYESLKRYDAIAQEYGQMQEFFKGSPQAVELLQWMQADPRVVDGLSAALKAWIDNGELSPVERENRDLKRQIEQTTTQQKQAQEEYQRRQEVEVGMQILREERAELEAKHGKFSDAEYVKIAQIAVANEQTLLEAYEDVTGVVSPRLKPQAQQAAVQHLQAQHEKLRHAGGPQGRPVTPQVRDEKARVTPDDFMRAFGV